MPLPHPSSVLFSFFLIFTSIPLHLLLPLLCCPHQCSLPPSLSLSQLDLILPFYIVFVPSLLVISLLLPLPSGLYFPTFLPSTIFISSLPLQSAFICLLAVPRPSFISSYTSSYFLSCFLPPLYSSKVFKPPLFQGQVSRLRTRRPRWELNLQCREQRIA